MTYEDRFVAFIDLIGFKELVSRSVSDPSAAILLAEMLAIFHETSSRVGKNSPRIEVTHFSDSLVISIPSAPRVSHPLGDLLWFINLVAYRILSKGFLLRGGISLGPVYHSKSTVFGNAMVQAYRLESEIAEFPRIILSKNVREKLDELEPHDKEKILVDVNDGPAYVHILANEERIGLRWSGFGGRGVRTEPDDDEKIENLKHIREHVIARLEDSRDTPHHFKKNLWFVQYLNEKVLAAGMNGPMGWPELIDIRQDRLA